MHEVVRALVPLGLFAGVTVVAGLLLWFRYRTRSDIQATVRAAIDKGQELSPEIIDRLGAPRPRKEQDLRRAMLWLALGVAVCLCGVFVPDASGEVLPSCLAGAAFPACVGAAYLLMWRFGRYEP